MITIGHMGDRDLFPRGVEFFRYSISKGGVEGTQVH